MPRVSTPDGVLWSVRRRWLPWRRRGRDVDLGPDIVDMGGDDGIGLLAVVAIIIVLILLAPVLILAGEWIVLVAILPLMVLARLAWLTPWPIEVRRGDELVHTAKVRGWGPSRRFIGELAAEIARTPDTQL